MTPPPFTHETPAPPGALDPAQFPAGPALAGSVPLAPAEDARTPSPANKSLPKQSGRRALATALTLLPYLWPRQWEMRVRVVGALLLLLAAQLCKVVVPILYKKAIDSLGASASGHLSTAAIAAAGVPVAIILAYGLARVLSQAFGELRDAVFIKVAARAIREIALQTFDHLHRLSLRFHLDRRTGGLARSIERGTSAIQELLSTAIFNILPTIVEIALVTGILWSLFDVWFALVTFVTIVGYIAFTLYVTEWRTKYRREMNDTDSEANTKAVDSLLNYETVKYFGNEGHEARRYDKSLARYEKALIRSEVTLSLLNVGQGAIIAGGLAAIMLMAGQGVVAGRMTIGDFVLVNTYLIQLYIPLNFLGFVYRQVRQSLIDMEELFGLMKIHAEIADAPDAKPLAISGGEIRFDRVSFGYDARRPILKDVSFAVPPGKTVAIVGPSGAGKSTVSRLLFRFYETSAGRVLIDGQNIMGVTQASLRAAIGIVPQDTVLFNDTIYYNIAYSRPDARRDEIEEAARLARIDGFIRALPDGYETMVGERGLKLSGGEKQRVAIARTILKRPRILLFDEATSALDSKTEQEIQASLREVSAERTTLVIAHRLSTVVDADEILVLEEGRIVERGRHADLLRRQGKYAAMWARQQEAAERERLGSDAREPVAAEA
ncbi:MAG TPA: ABC transporter ATP-binding protein/permease [Alphaproteobacteria bacterium]|nr:ABC transporter ATP-binding protein/permease [Alphaproteobacteria bacterium]